MKIPSKSLSWRWAFVLSLMLETSTKSQSDLKKRIDNKLSVARGHSLGRCSDLWSGLSDHDLPICRHSPFNVLPGCHTSMQAEATLQKGLLFSFCSGWIYLLEKVNWDLALLESGIHRNLAAKMKVPEFLSPRVGPTHPYLLLPALGRWNSFRFACAVAGKTW